MRTWDVTCAGKREEKKRDGEQEESLGGPPVLALQDWEAVR
jgi:hypothetical protein